MRPTSKNLIPYLLLVSAMAGCTHLQEWNATGKVGPNYLPRVAPIAAEWQQCNGPHFISMRNAVADDCWWRAFGDPEIEKLVAAANSQYLPLRAAMLRVQEQAFLRCIAVGNLAPQQQQFFADYQRIQFGRNGNQFGIPGFGNSFDLYQFGFNASWEIDLWGRIRRLVEASDASLQATIEDEYDVRLALTADVIATYVEIRVLQKRIGIAHDQVEAQRETLRIAEAKFSNGATSKLDVTQATSLVQTTLATIPPLQSQLRQANNRLCLLLGMPTRLLFDEHNVAQIPLCPESLVVGMPCDLLRRRPDIRKAEREIAAQSARIGVAAAELFPALSLNGTLNWQSFAFSNLFESGSTAGVIAPGIRWNILNYGRLRNNVRVQETRLEQAVVSYEQTVLNANTEAEDAMTVFGKKLEEIAAVKQSIEAVESSVDLADTQYRQGDIELDRVNDLRKELISQLDLHAALKGQAVLAMIRVFKTMGGGWYVNPTIPNGCFAEELASQRAVPNGSAAVTASNAQQGALPNVIPAGGFIPPPPSGGFPPPPPPTVPASCESPDETEDAWSKTVILPLPMADGERRRDFRGEVPTIQGVPRTSAFTPNSGGPVQPASIQSKASWTSWPGTNFCNPPVTIRSPG